MTLRSATVSVALTIERSLAFNNETAAAPEEAQATETVALRRKHKRGQLIILGIGG